MSNIDAPGENIDLKKYIALRMIINYYKLKQKDGANVSKQANDLIHKQGWYFFKTFSMTIVQAKINRKKFFFSS